MTGGRNRGVTKSPGLCQMFTYKKCVQNKFFKFPSMT